MKYDGAWREQLALDDGTLVSLRLLRPEDAPILQRGFDALSPTSRWHRFLSAKTNLTPSELSYLTDVDGTKHLAIAAGLASDEEQGIGVARFIQIPEAPDVVEAAIVVVDEYQGRGLGRALLRRLIEAARERGYRSLRSTVGRSNARMRATLEEIAPGSTTRGEEEIDIPLGTR